MSPSLVILSQHLKQCNYHSWYSVFPPCEGKYTFLMTPRRRIYPFCFLICTALVFFYDYPNDLRVLGKQWLGRPTFASRSQVAAHWCVSSTDAWRHLIVTGGSSGCRHRQWIHIHSPQLANGTARIDLQSDKSLPRAPRQFILLPLHEATTPHRHLPIHQGESLVIVGMYRGWDLCGLLPWGTAHRTSGV